MAKSKRGKAPRRVREAAVKPNGPVEVSASELKNDWHHWLDRVARERETVVVTRYGKPVATLAPVAPAEPVIGIFGSMRGSVISYTDLISPIEGDDMIWTADEANVTAPMEKPADDE
ncbi:MAG TPA: type II toxin-antitoxin system prevent-host-death family antitoxin [Gemmatimonadales bacterium]|nr:type II toxin-antitoxin system prevent-host-death family antitoxin [Gemmatimonadales bacterium]